MPTSAVAELRDIPFGMLIGEPLKAVVQGQCLAAQATVDFIQQIGFQQPAADSDPVFDQDDPDLGKLRQVTFQYNKKNLNGDDENATFTVPLLSILPIPLLRVEETIVEFNAKLTDVQEYSRKENDKRGAAMTARGGLSVGFFRMRSSFRGSVAQEKTFQTASRYNREYTMRVYVRAVQDDIPAGLARVFQILENTIKEKLPAPTP